MVNLVRARQGARRVAPAPRQDSDFYPMEGGLNLIDSPLHSEPGQCQAALNYEMGFEGGYKRVGGYEGFDGRPGSHSPDYFRLPIACDKKPMYEEATQTGDFQWPVDQVMLRGRTSGAMGLMIDLQESGGYGKNVLLYNTTYDDLAWDKAVGTSTVIVDAFHDPYVWDQPDALVGSLRKVRCNNASSKTFIMEHLNNPIAVVEGDQLYVSVLCRKFEARNSDNNIYGFYLTIENGVGDPFGSPSSAPQIQFDVKRGYALSSSAHWEEVGVDVLSDKVVRCWGRTKMCEVADATLTVRYQLLQEAPIGTWNTTFNGAWGGIYMGGSMAIVLEAGENPQNNCHGRLLNNTTNWSKSSTLITIADGATAWASGVYSDFTRVTMPASATSSFFIYPTDTSLTNPHWWRIASYKGDRFYFECYVQFTAGNVAGILVTDWANSAIAREDYTTNSAGWDIENGVVATLINGSANTLGNIESQAIEQISSNIYKLSVTFNAFDHAAVHAPIIKFTALHAQGDLDDSWTTSATPEFVDITGVKMMMLQSGGDRVAHKEVVTAGTAKNCNTGYAIIAGRGLGPKFIEGETLHTLIHMWDPQTLPIQRLYEDWSRDVGIALGPQQLNDEPNATLDASYRAESLRLADGPTRGRQSSGVYLFSTPTPVIPPGTGPVRGIFYHNGFVFAFRDSDDGTTGKMWKSSGVGWREVSQFVQAIPFDAGTGTEPAVGLEIETSSGSVSALVIHVETNSGTWGTDAAGFIYVKRNNRYTHNDWPDNATLRDVATATSICLVDGAGSDIDEAAFLDLQPGGKYEFREGNLYGATDRQRLYWVNGVDTAYEYNDLLEGFAPIKTGMADDTPTHLAIHNYHLFLSFNGGSVQLSGDGDPYAWTVITGATEIAVGDEVTGFNEEVGNSLFIFTRNKSFVLQGNTRANFSLDDFNINAGAQEWSVQRIGLGMFFDDRGFTSLLQTQRSGSVNFQENAQSELIQPLVEDLVRTTEVKTSHLIRKENIYRCYFADGRIVSIGFQQHKVSGHMPLEYPFVANVSCSNEAETGAEQIFVGTDAGEVFEIEVGNSFDGTALEAFIRTVLYHSKTPGRFKKYSHIRLDGTFKGNLTMSGRVEADFDDPNLNLGDELVFNNDSAGGYWDNFVWDEFIWDRSTQGNPQEKVEVEGTNVAIYLRTNSAIDPSHTIRGVTLQWLARRSDRRV